MAKTRVNRPSWQGTVGETVSGAHPMLVWFQLCLLLVGYDPRQVTSPLRASEISSVQWRLDGAGKHLEQCQACGPSVS